PVLPPLLPPVLPPLLPPVLPPLLPIGPLGPLAAPSAVPSATPPPGCGIGATCHVLLAATFAPSPILVGPCPRPIVNCVELTVTGSFTVLGAIRGLARGSGRVLAMPVAGRGPAAAGTRRVPCAAADATGTATCQGAVAEPNVVPLPGGLVSVTVSAAATATATATVGAAPTGTA